MSLCVGELTKLRVAGFAACVALVVSASAGCLPRERFNKNCEWTGDAAYALDLRNLNDRQHLIEDAQLAEELAARYADFKHREPYGYEGHGGLLNGRRVVRECLASLDQQIVRDHHVTGRQVADAREVRDWRFDLAVLGSFVVLYVAGAIAALTLLMQRFGDDPAAVRIVAAAFASLVVSAAGVQVLGMWATIAEIVRIGNDHLGPIRGARIPWERHGAMLFIGGVAIALAAAVITNSRTRQLTKCT